ncbi:MAG TPA: BlaI/MecI/CopY family transcriptional regulator [Anaerolineae bacterium]
MNIHAFRLNQHGLARLFGDLEAKIMNAVWALEEPTVQDVVKRLGKRANYKTVMTVMNRLVEKGFLERRKVSRAFVYLPRLTREALMERLSRQVLDGLLADFGPTVVAQFVEAIEETDRARLAELAKLVESKLDTGKGADV